MTIKVAINGYGRIGRCILRAIYERKFTDKIQVVAINDLGDVPVLAHLTQYDTAHNKFPFNVSHNEHNLIIDNEEIKVVHYRDPLNLPWSELDVDVVLECTGHFASREGASKHLTAGAKKVLISAPAGEEVDKTIVYGVNHASITSDDRIVSNASCTTNCLAPLAKVLNDEIGIESGLMNTVHAYTNDQVLTDVYHKDVRRARSATSSMIPTKTGAAKAVGLVLPELEGKLDGFAIRVPVINVSLVDLSIITKRDTSLEEVNKVLKHASEGFLKEVLEYNTLPLVSHDFNHNPASSIFDSTQTKVNGRLVKVLSWYDNEWGFSNRMLDVAMLMGNK